MFAFPNPPAPTLTNGEASAEIARIERQQEAQYRENAERYLIMQADAEYEEWTELKDRYGDEVGPSPPKILAVLDILSVEHHQSFGGCRGRIVARVKCPGCEQVVSFHCKGDYGASDSPFEIWLEWENDRI